MDEPYCDISFSEKVRIYSYDLLKCCRYITGFSSPKYIFTKKLYSRLIASSQLLEDFLDFHGAKNNKQWYYYRELAACFRHLSLAGYALRHISNRLTFYDLVDYENSKEEGDNTVEFLTSSMHQLAPEFIKEAESLEISIPDGAFEQANFPGVVTSYMLDYDIDDQDKDLQKQSIVKIASEFLEISKSFNHFRFYEPYSIEEMKDIVPSKINEVEIRRYEMLIHNLQSSFDSYVIHGGFRHGNRKLKQFRGYFSIVFHLLQIMGRLLHFYERHLYEVGYKDIYKRIRDNLSLIVDIDEILDRTINYGLYYVCFFLNEGQKLAKSILNENIERSSITVGIPVTRGFHSRPSLMVAKIVQHFGGQVELIVAEDRFDASSVLDIQWAGGKIQKEQIEKVTFEGDSRALNDIEILAGVNYGEDSMGKGIPLPPELKYLK